MTKQNFNPQFLAFAEKMRSAEMPDIAIANFRNNYQKLLAGENGFVSESSIRAVDELSDSENLNQEHLQLGEKALASTVLIKLNGGLGTSMGLNKAKSLIRVKQNFTFLDIIIRHALQSKVHLVLMNSFSTQKDCRKVLQTYPSLLDTNPGLDFVQHKVPKIRQDDFAPISSNNEQLDWCPPGHGDIYISLYSSGMLDNLLKANYRYAFISNSDNLGATLDSSLLGFMVKKKLPFLMEVTDRTEADKKGGHLARSLNGRLILRESAQCLDQDRDNFEDISKYRYFNTNNLWIDLQTLQNTLVEQKYILDLPFICNKKTVDPRNNESEPVFQLESAMGAAIGVLDGAQAIRVPRSRFAPVKTTNDLLLVQSDVYHLTDRHTLSSKVGLNKMPMINLDRKYFGMIDDFEMRFPSQIPSLLACKKLDVIGDIIFGDNISIEGHVRLKNERNEQLRIPDNSFINEDMSWE
jgi:UTP--glucose-1-phosphate uridylyltransferase